MPTYYRPDSRPAAPIRRTLAINPNGQIMRRAFTRGSQRAARGLLGHRALTAAEYSSWRDQRRGDFYGD